MSKEIDWSTVEIDGIDTRDYPDFCDVYISYAEYSDGTPLTDDEMEIAAAQYSDKLWSLAHDRIRI